MMQFIFPYPMALTNSSIFGTLLLSLPHQGVPKIGKCVVIAVTAASFAFAVISLLNPTLPIRILPYYLVFLVLYLLLLFASIISESVKAGKIFSTSVCGILAFNTCALLELILYLSNMKAYNQSNILTLGLLLFCIFMVVDSTQNFAQVYRAAIKVVCG